MGDRDPLLCGKSLCYIAAIVSPLLTAPYQLVLGIPCCPQHTSCCKTSPTGYIFLDELGAPEVSAPIQFQTRTDGTVRGLVERRCEEITVIELETMHREPAA